MAVLNMVICGPTASGKSALAMKMAEQIGAEILSVDSMQIYRGMDIGTAKPTPGERRRVRHHLIDIVDPSESFTVAQFVAQADAVLAEAAARGTPIIITGGTPMYYKALFEGIFEGPSADDNFRAGLAKTPQAELHQRLSRIDPPAAARIHVNDRRRLVRALEVYELTGKPMSDHQQQWGSEHRHAAEWVGLSWEKELLNRRINQRVKQMIADGWVGETKSLFERYGALSKTAGEATGYGDLIEHLNARTSLDDAVEQIKIATRQLARRQMKWFRRWPQIKWVDGQLSSEQIQASLAL